MSTPEQDVHAGHDLAVKVSELASWLAEAPGFINIPDHFFEALETMAETACVTLGIEVPEYEDEDNNVIDIVVKWLKEWDENHPDE